MSRFDYVKYDERTQHIQERFKQTVTELESEIIDHVSPGRASMLALTALEECYMWIGKALRDDQIKRNGSAELQESRG